MWFPMRKLLLQLDSSRLPSVFDQVVAYDAGAEIVMSYGGVTEGDVRDLIHGCIFTRGPKDLHNTAVWIGGSNMSAGEQLLAMAQDALFAPFSVSIMLDSNGSNTTAVAAVVKIEETLGDLAGKKVLILAGTGPVGQRAAGLLAKDGAQVTITSRKPEQGEKARQFISARFNVPVDAVTLNDPSKLPELLQGVEVLLNSGPAGVQLVPRAAWTEAKTLKIAVDLNAVPPLGIEGIEVSDAGVRRDDVVVFGAFGVGNFKTKLHKTCVARLFTRNDLVLDAEAIAEIARELISAKEPTTRKEPTARKEPAAKKELAKKK
jgi:ribulose 1,5-bisphosphate synthetase/thiazole synthase